MTYDELIAIYPQLVVSQWCFEPKCKKLIALAYLTGQLDQLEKEIAERQDKLAKRESG